VDRTNLKRDDIWAFHRLNIMNTDSDGMQPFISESSTLVCNGEIYNFASLNRSDQIKSDCHVIQLLLDANNNPLDVCRQLDGDFAFIYKGANGMVAGRDHAGVCPLFYGRDKIGEIVAFASEMKALICCPHITKIYVFPPGHVYVNDTFQCYLNTPVEIKPDYLTAVKYVRDLIVKSVRKRIEHGIRPVGVLCSGGIDSAIITCLLKELHRDDIHVFTMEYENARSEDAFYATMLCDRLGLKHTVFSFNLEDAKRVYSWSHLKVDTEHVF
jgi:asparagine synthase (glutamine-hydrolysing)